LREKHRLRVFENMVQRKPFGRKRGAITGEWRRLYEVELYDPYCPRNIIRENKSRKVRSAEHVERMKGERRDAYRVSVGKLEVKSHLKDLGVEGRIILKLIFNKRVGGAWTRLIWLRIGTGGRLL
jgi:hypothetical protein